MLMTHSGPTYSHNLTPCLLWITTICWLKCSFVQQQLIMKRGSIIINYSAPLSRESKGIPLIVKSDQKLYKEILFLQSIAVFLYQHYHLFFSLSWKSLYVVVHCVILPGEWFTGGRLQNRVIIILTFICSWVLHKRLHLDNMFSLSATSTVKLNFPSGQYFLCPKRSIASKHRELSRI